MMIEYYYVNWCLDNTRNPFLFLAHDIVSNAQLVFHLNDITAHYIDMIIIMMMIIITIAE